MFPAPSQWLHGKMSVRVMLLLSCIQMCEFVFSLLSAFSLILFHTSKYKLYFLTQDALLAQKANSNS